MRRSRRRAGPFKKREISGKKRKAYRARATLPFAAWYPQATITPSRESNPSAGGDELRRGRYRIRARRNARRPPAAGTV
jgi:hypothetical protein